MWELYKNIKARFILKQWLFNDPYDYKVDLIIDDIITSSHFVIFNNGNLITNYDDIEITCWNRNKYYGWLNHGTVKRKGILIISWKRKRPSVQTMVKLKKYIERIY